MRGYFKTSLRRAFNKAAGCTRTSLLYPSPCTTNTNAVKIVTQYSAHHEQPRSIISKHWHLLADHHILKHHVHATPELFFRRAKSLRDRLVSSHYKPNSVDTHQSFGTFPCGQCSYCPWILSCTSFRLPNGEFFTPHTLAQCDTTGIIYLMLCTCKAFYVGKTIREFRQRVNDHVYYSTNVICIYPYLVTLM